MRDGTAARLDGTLTGPEEPDEREGLADLFRELHSSHAGLTSREAERRLLMYGPITLTRRAGRRWSVLILAQLTQPLALLLVLAAVLAVLGAGRSSPSCSRVAGIRALPPARGSRCTISMSRPRR